jgi:hypothetical protein
MEEAQEQTEQPKKLSGAQQRKALRTPWKITEPPKPKPRRRASLPVPQILTGTYGTADYATIKEAYRKRTKLQFQGVLYRVLAVQVLSGEDGKMFRAMVQRAAS